MSATVERKRLHSSNSCIKAYFPKIIIINLYNRYQNSIVPRGIHTPMQFTSMKTAKTLKALILLQRCSIQNTLVRLLLLQFRQLCKVQEELVTLAETRWTCWNSVGLVGIDEPLLPRKQIAHRYDFPVLHFRSQTASTIIIPIAEYHKIRY